MYPKLKMAPTTANSLLLRTISLQNVKCKIASYKKFYFFVYVCVRAGERKNRHRDRDKRVCVPSANLVSTGFVGLFFMRLRDNDSTWRDRNLARFLVILKEIMGAWCCWCHWSHLLQPQNSQTFLSSALALSFFFFCLKCVSLSPMDFIIIY